MRTYSEVLFSLFDTTAKQDSTPMTIDIESFCDLQQLKVDTIPQMPKYATCEQGQFLLDGNMQHFPEEPQTDFWGYWSDSISDGTGLFAVPPILEFTFDQPHSSAGLTIHGYAPTEEWTSKLQVQWYNANNERLATAIAQPDKVHYFINKKVENYHKVTLTFFATNKPFRRIKLSGIDYGVRLTFSHDEVISAKIIEEIDLECNQLRINTLDLTIFSKDAFFSMLNPVGAFSVLQDKQEFTIYEYQDDIPTLMGSYYLSEWSNSSNTIADFTAISKLGLLDNEAHLGGIYDTTFSILVAEILKGYDYEIDESLVDIPIKGYLPIGTRRSSLQQLCMAVGAVVDCSRCAKINLFPPPTRPSVYIPKKRKFQGSKVTLRSLVTAVEVTAYTYVKGDVEKELCKETLEAGTYKYTFESPMHSYVLTGGTIIESGDNYVNITVSLAGDVYLVGKEYIVSCSVFRRLAEDIPANAQENIVKVEKATLISHNLAEAVAQRLLDYYAYRYEVSFKMRLIKEHLADSTIVENYGNEKIRGNIESMNVDLTGGNLASVVVLGKRLDTTWRYYIGDELYCSEESAII